MALPTGFQIRDKGFPLSALEYWARQARLRLSQRLSRILVKHQVPKVSIHGSLFDSFDIESQPNHTAGWDTIFSHIYLLER